MKYVNQVDDLKVITKYSKQAPIPISLLLKSEGIGGLRELESFGGYSSRLLHKAASAGKPGFAALRKSARSVQRIERLLKAVPLFGRLLVWAVRNIVAVRWLVLLLAIVMNIRGLWLITYSVRKIHK